MPEAGNHLIGVGHHLLDQVEICFGWSLNFVCDVDLYSYCMDVVYYFDYNSFEIFLEMQVKLEEKEGLMSAADLDYSTLAGFVGTVASFALLELEHQNESDSDY